jgi:hypothetical protein
MPSARVPDWGSLPGGLPDRQLAKRLARDAELAAKAQLRTQRAYDRALARRSRLMGKARRALPVQLVVSIGAVVTSVAIRGDDPFWVVGAVAGVLAARSAGRLRHPPPLPPAPAPALPALPPPPHPRSAAFPAVRRLEAVREELRRLLPLVAPAGRDAATEAWQAAAEADVALRWQASRLAAVEPHRGVDAQLLAQLEAGVAAQERVVTAVADLVAASADPLATGRLQDATDAVHGLAQGLREVR